MARRIQMTVQPKDPPRSWSPGDGWEVKKQTNANASKVTKTKQAAINWAEKHARNSSGVYELVIADSNFNIQDRKTI